MSLPKVAKIQMALAILVLVSLLPGIWELFACGYCWYNQHVTLVVAVVNLPLIVGFMWFTIPARRNRLLWSVGAGAGVSLLTLIAFIYFMM